MWGKVKGWCRRVYKGFREVLRDLKAKNPQAYQNGYTITLWFIDLLPTLLAVSSVSSGILMALLSLAFLFGILLYGAELKNRYEKTGLEILDDAISNISNMQQKELHTATMYYNLARRISDGCAYMMSGRIDPDDRIGMDLNDIANTIEGYLSKYYGYDVCVNIKLMLVDNIHARTFARGARNISNRGGEQKVHELNLTDVDISQNYALNMILTKSLECFIDGNLEKLSTYLTPSDTFRCDRDDWSQYFKATAIFPIRGISKQQRHDHVRSYDFLGFICVDANRTTDWHRGEDCMVYDFGSFCADILYDYLMTYKMVKQ